jgi:hypothetical protein
VKVHDVRWSNNGFEPADKHFSMKKEMLNHHFYKEDEETMFL